MPASVIASTDDAPWLPRGGRADVVVDVGGTAPDPTGPVRLLVRRGERVFCTPRSGSGRLDLPTRSVPTLDDGRSAVKDLVRDVMGRAADATLVGYVRNTVDVQGDAYPWPTPVAHFSVWAVDGEPACEGTWVDAGRPDSPLRERHWWPLLRATPLPRTGVEAG